MMFKIINDLIDIPASHFVPKQCSFRGGYRFLQLIEFGDFAIEFVPFAIEFVPFAIEFVGFAIEFVPFAIEFVAFAIEFVAFAVKFVHNKNGSWSKHENMM